VRSNYSLAQNNSVTDKKVQILETRGKETQLYNTAKVCLGLGGRRKHTLQDNPILQVRISTAEGSSGHVVSQAHVPPGGSERTLSHGVKKTRP
jgi:hypothetical protein